MIKIIGILKKEDTKQFTKKDGTQGEVKNIYVEPEGSIYPIKINTSDINLSVGQIGDKVELEVAVFPYYFEDKKRKKAFIDYYIPVKK